MAGYCPACGAWSLTRTDDGVLRCMVFECPDRDAAAKILSDPEVHHVVVFTKTGYTIRHPLRERIDDALLDCQLHVACGQHGPPDGPGKYRVEHHVYAEGEAIRNELLWVFPGPAAEWYWEKLS